MVLPPFASGQSALININTATLGELDTLPGVGLSVAQSIIDNRPYTTKEEISRAAGIGEPGSVSYENIIGLITVGDSDSSSEESIESESPTNTNQASSVPVYSEVNKVEAKVDLDIGKDRTGSVGSPMIFKVRASLSNIQNGDFKWNFGDGSLGYGKESIHAYEYPGEYTLVLTLGSVAGESARVSVKVIDPEFSIVEATSERIEIKNNSKAEASLYGRVISVGDRLFIFPHNTFVKPGQSISFSSKVTGLIPKSIFEVSIVAVGDAEQARVGEKVREEKHRQISKIQMELGALEEKLALAMAYAPPVNTAAASVVATSTQEETASSLEESNYSQTALVKDGWWQVLKRFLMKNQ